jgi:hypothetical protein
MRVMASAPTTSPLSAECGSGRLTEAGSGIAGVREPSGEGGGAFPGAGTRTQAEGRHPSAEGVYGEQPDGAEDHADLEQGRVATHPAAGGQQGLQQVRALRLHHARLRQRRETVRRERDPGDAAERRCARIDGDGPVDAQVFAGQGVGRRVPEDRDVLRGVAGVDREPDDGVDEGGEVGPAPAEVRDGLLASGGPGGGHGDRGGQQPERQHQDRPELPEQQEQDGDGSEARERGRHQQRHGGHDRPRT